MNNNKFEFIVQKFLKIEIEEDIKLEDLIDVECMPDIKESIHQIIEELSLM